MAVRAVIMRAQRIYLRDTRHRRRQRGTNGSSRTNQISILIRLPNQLLRDDIHNGESIGNDRVKFPLQPIDYHLRQLIAVHIMRVVVADGTKRIIRIRNNRRTLVRAYRGNALTHRRDLARVCDNDLLRLIAA